MGHTPAQEQSHPPEATGGERIRTLGVFAHPDDETLGGGPVLAMMSRRGPVTVVTCNRGERGEVIGADLAHLADDPDALARHRVAELTGAVQALGVSAHHFLDELPGLGDQRPPRYTDSGMQWPEGSTGIRAEPADDVDASAFSLSDTDVSARLLAGLIRRTRPHLVLTEEPDGGYGHPDHVQANRVAMRAVELAAFLQPGDAGPDDPLADAQPWTVPVAAWVVRPHSRVQTALTWLDGERDRPTVSAHTGGPHRVLEPGAGLPAIVRPDEQVDLDIDATAVAGQLAEAMRSHASQVQAVQVDALYLQRSGGNAVGWFGLSNDLLQPVPARATAMVAPGWGDAAALASLVSGPGGGHLGTPVTGTPAAVPGSGDQPPQLPPPRWYALTMIPFAFLIGAIIAAVGTAFHRWQTPFGLILALVTVLAGSLLARSFADSRGLVAYAAAVVLTVLAMTYLTVEAEVIVTGEPIGVAWLLSAPAFSFLGILAPRGWFRD